VLFSKQKLDYIFIHACTSCFSGFQSVELLLPKLFPGIRRNKEYMIRIIQSVSLILALVIAIAFSVTPSSALQFPPDGFSFGPGMGAGGGRLQLVKKFDTDGDGRLNAAERKTARTYLASSQGRFGGPGGRWGGGFFGFGGMGGSAESPKRGAKLTPADVKSGGDAPLYDPNTLRTFFLQFEDSDWEKEMEDFYHTDVDVPATLIVDGKTYKDVGVHFHGNSSFSLFSTGQKRSLNLSLEYAHKGQNVGGYRVLNLLNNSDDPTFLHVVLFSEIVRSYIPSAKANYVRVVINGESWGIYSNIQQLNKDFTRDFFNSEDGARWKVPGLQMQGGLQYLGDNPSSYKSTYQIKSKDKPESWQALIALCKTLNQEPLKTLKTALAPMLDIEGALKFLALDIAMVNDDGYWTRASDYYLYLDKKGLFHVLPYDMNETFSSGEEGPGMGGMMGFGGGSTSLDPLTGADSTQLSLTSKLLAVPALRAQYLEIVRDIAQKWLDWERLGPVARRYHELIAADVKTDTRKLYSTEEFDSGLKTIESFAAARRTYLLSKTEAKSR
jgi:hypothetical protein